MDYNMTHVRIVHIGETTMTGDTVVYENRHAVSRNGSHVFEGTYTQCLTFIGAMTIGKSPKTARNFALGTYR